jgi:hypothetical protein
MKQLWIICLLLAAIPMALVAQGPGTSTVTTVRLVADMNTSNEAPPVSGAQGSGTAEVILNLTRNVPSGVDPETDEQDFLNDIFGFGGGDTNGDSRFSEVTSASVELRANVNLAQDETFTGFHIHSGASGENGPIVVGPQFGDPEPILAGPGSLTRTLANTDNMTLEAIGEILRNPRAFYANLHTESNPNGFMRGQLRLGEEFQQTRTDRILSNLDLRLAIVMENVNRISRKLGVVPVEDEIPPGDDNGETPPPAPQQ